MDDAKFMADWEVHQRIEKLAIEALKSGVSIEEAQKIVIGSNEYMEWESIERCFGTEYHQLFYYRDLLGAIEFEEYADRVKQIAKLVMDGKQIDGSSENMWKYEYDRLFNQIGIKITPVELGEQIGLLSRKINVKEPLGVLQFLGLITNNASALLYLDLEEVTVLKNSENEIVLFLEEFVGVYSDGK